MDRKGLLTARPVIAGETTPATEACLRLAREELSRLRERINIILIPEGLRKSLAREKSTSFRKLTSQETKNTGIGRKL